MYIDQFINYVSEHIIAFAEICNYDQYFSICHNDFKTTVPVLQEE